MQRLNSMARGTEHAPGRKRRPRAEAKLSRIVSAQQARIRQTTMALFVLRLAPIVVPVVLRFALDPILQQSGTSLLGIRLSPGFLLGVLVATGAAVAITRAVANYFYLTCSSRAGHGLVADLRVAMYEHILRLPVAYADRRGTGRILLRFIGDSDALRAWISRRRPAAMADRLLLSVLMLAMVAIDWRLAALAILPLPFVLYAIKRLSPRLRNMTRRARRSQSEFTGYTEAHLDSLRQTKWLDRDRRNRLEMRELAGGIAQQNAARDRQSALLDSVGQLLTFLAIPLLLGVGIWFSWSGRVTIGHFVAFIWLAVHWGVTMRRLNSAVVSKQKADVSIERILSLLQRTAEPGRSSRKPSLVPAGQTLACEDLVIAKKGLGSAREPFNLRCDGPGVYALDRRIDAASLYDVILGFRTPTSGRLELDGQSVGEAAISSVRQAIGWVPQTPAAFEGTVLQNVRLAAPELSRDDTVRILQDFCGSESIEEWAERQAGPNGEKLCRDDVTRIGILRVIVNPPSFVLLEDVPTSAQGDADMLRLLSWLREKAVILQPATLAARLNVKAERVGRIPSPVEAAGESAGRSYGGENVGKCGSAGTLSRGKNGAHTPGTACSSACHSR